MPDIDNWRALRDALETWADNEPWAFGSFAGGRIHIGTKSGLKHDPLAVMSGAGSIPWDATAESREAYNAADYIAAAHPAAIRSLLDERDRLAAEVESLRADAARLNWLDGAIFVHRWNGVIDSGSRVNWSVAGDYRHTCNNMVGNDFRAAIDAAMKGKP